MYEIQQDALGAELKGWLRGFSLVLMARPRDILPNRRSQWREVRALGLQRYREEWMGEHEVMSETAWIDGWRRGWEVAMILRNGLDVTQRRAEKAVTDVHQAIMAWTNEREAREREEAAEGQRQPKPPRRPRHTPHKS